SFQLSFLALAGILVLGDLVRRPLSGILPRFALLAVAMSAGAQAATLPLVIAAFGSWYPSGLLASLVLVPLTTAYLWAGLAWLPLSLVPWTALQDFVSAAFAVFYRVISASADVFARIPGIVVPPPAVPWLAAGAGLAVAAAATVLPVKARTAR
ncbi:MAG TPA: ComEC/Rec2 family competence protein, partial [Spirochaetia bacterium]|nr:ComEC/Rec2 family competence protein [Spirochaetia bacterium]